MTEMKQAVQNGKAVIALFRVNQAQEDTIAYYYELGTGLYLTDFSRTWIFSAFPK